MDRFRKSAPLVFKKGLAMFGMGKITKDDKAYMVELAGFDFSRSLPFCVSFAVGVCGGKIIGFFMKS